MSNPKFQIGSLIEFSRNKFEEGEGEYSPYEEKYHKGNKGHVIAVSDTKVSTAKSLEQMIGNDTSEYMYTIRVAMSDIIKVPESAIFNPNSDIAQKVEKRLREKQEKKEFKDTSGRIGGSAKEKALYRNLISLSDLSSIEEDENTAIELIKKDKVYPKVDVTAEREKGMSSGVTFLKVKLRESFPNEPANNKDKRKLYVGYANYLVQKFENIISVEDFDKARITLLSSESFAEIVKILRPELADEIENEKEANAERLNQVNAEILEVDNKRHTLVDEIKIKFPELWNEQHTVFKWSQVTDDDKDKIEHDRLDALFYGLQGEQTALSKDFTTIERDFILSIGFGGKSFYGISSILRQIISEVFGKRFLNFITKGSKAVDEVFEKAQDYEALTLAESIMLIEKNSGYYSEWIVKYQKQIDDVKALVNKEQHDEYFKAHGNMTFSGGDFAVWGRGYWGYNDLKTVEQIEAYKKRYILNLEKNIDEKNKHSESVKEKYRPRENNWDWAFDKKKSGDKKERTELKVNSYPPLSFIKRTGGVKIVDADITPESIREKFGFKEVEFGQSLKDTEAKEHVRHFLGAMADLADILNMNVVELNKLGGLSIAFASRGSGKASAHYESLRKVINVTKSRGGGAIAHEYMHYLDNILPKIERAEYSYKEWASVITESRYGNKTSVVVNQNVFRAIDAIFEYIYKRKLPPIEGRVVEPRKVEIKVNIEASDKGYQIPTSFYKNGSSITPTDIDEYFELFKERYSQYRFYENLKKRDVSIIGSIVKKFGLTNYEFTFSSNKSQYYANSIAMGSDYWSREWELFARAFETYIYDKLDKQGRANNYLVSGDYFDRPEGVYPQGVEREDLFTLYDALISTIKKEYNISDFVAWTSERVDEYIALEGDKKETVEAGVIVEENTDEVIETVGDNAQSEKEIENRKINARRKLQDLVELLRAEKMESGGEISTSDSITDKLNNFLVNL